MNCGPHHRVEFISGLEFAKSDTITDWQIVNDGVMGGCSRSQFVRGEGTAIFAGELSLDNNGGFASVRSLRARHDWPEATGVAIRVRGDGRSYRLIARMETNFERALYQAPFNTLAGEWQEHSFRCEEFAPSFRGRDLAGEPALVLAQMASVGFMIADRQAGPFRLEVAWIRAFRNPRV